MIKKIFIFILVIFSICFVYGTIPLEERNALIAFYYSTHGESWTDNTNWLGPEGTECDWFGIECDSAEEHVIAIRMGYIDGWPIGNNLVGTLPATIIDLPYLQVLDVNFNWLSGSIPVEMASLSQLRTLYLGFNYFDLGSIPNWIYDRTSIWQLDLADCYIQGEIPANLTNLSNLVILNLGGNQLEGTIPGWLGDFENMWGIWLWGNQLNGRIPAELSLPSLVYLSLFENQLGGEIPPEIGDATGLCGLWLYDNKLGGKIPSELGRLENLEWLSLNGNRLTGEIPSELTALTNLLRINLHYNTLYTSNAGLLDFINSLHAGGDFRATQTVAPNEAFWHTCRPGTAVVTWPPIWYTDDDGGYEIFWKGPSGGEYKLAGATAGKNDSSFLVDGLPAKQGHYFRVRAVTYPHIENQSTVTSDFRDAVMVEPDRFIPVLHNPEQSGAIYHGSSSQIVPATYMTFQMDPASFPEASVENPAIIQITLTDGAFLSQTLATGTPATSAPYPEAGEIVRDLAVVEYELVKENGIPVPVAGDKDLSDIPPYAVQLFRYVAGENSIQIRINDSTEDWFSAAYPSFYGFTIGLGAGVWPNTEYSNWGSEGMYSQEATLYYMDLRNFPFEEYDNCLPVCLGSFYQMNGAPTGAGFEPSDITLFKLEEYYEDEPPVVSQIGSTITDMTVVDLNRDGFDDVVTISAASNRLYWTFGQADGTFQGLEWRETVGFVPATVAAGDVNGDALPDILIGDESGVLWIYLWHALFAEKAKITRVSSVSMRVNAPGEPSDSILTDVNADGFNDYLYADQTGNSMTVMFGNDFSTTQTYAAGTQPVALTNGDFDGDADFDVAVANEGGNSITVFWNDGSGTFTQTQLTGIGQDPIDIDAADFDRNGKTDLAVALSGDKALSILLVQPNGQFDPAQAQKFYRFETPSALQADNFDALNGPDVLMGFSDYSKLSLYTSDESGSLGFAYNINTLGDVVVDPFNNVTLTEDNVLSVAGGTGFGGVSSRDGVGGITQQAYNVLHFPRSSDISFSVVNLADDDALLNLELYDDFGIFKSANTQQISSGTQFARYFSDLLGPDAAQSQHWVRAFMTQAETYGLWLVSDGGSLNYLDGTQVPDVRMALMDFVFPVLTIEWENYTSLILINPNLDSANVILTLYDQNGNPKANDNVLLSGRGRTVLDAGSVFPGLTTTDSVQVQSDRAIVGIEIFGDNAAVACLEGIPTGGSHVFLCSPHMAVGNLGVNYKSTLTVVNTSTGEAMLAITLFDDNGTQQGIPQFVSVAGHGKSVMDLATLFSLSGPATGYLGIDTNGAPGIVGCITFGDADNDAFVSCLPLQWEGHSDYLLGHIANGTLGDVSYFTGLAILNPDSETWDVEISAYNQFGVFQQAETLTLDGGHRQVFLLDGLMPGLTSIFGGYILVDGPDAANLIVFELFGNFPTLEFLSAVPAVPLE